MFESETIYGIYEDSGLLFVTLNEVDSVRICELKSEIAWKYYQNNNEDEFGESQLHEMFNIDGVSYSYHSFQVELNDEDEDQDEDEDYGAEDQNLDDLEEEDSEDDNEEEHFINFISDHDYKDLDSGEIFEAGSFTVFTQEETDELIEQLEEKLETLI